MSASGTLYTYPENFRAFKALIAAQFSGAKVTVDSSFVFGETNKSDAFLKKFPLGKVPAFESTDGKCIFESNAIAWAVANEQLRGKTPMDQAQVVSWMNFADNEILPASCTWVFPCLGIMQFNKGNTERAKEDIKKALASLNSHLLSRTFLVGERISLADITVCCTLLHLYQYVLEPAFRKPYQNVNRWFTTVVNQPQVKTVIGEFKLCEKMAQFDNKKFAEVQSKLKQGGGDKKKESKKEVKKEQPKEKKEKESSPPAAAPAPAPKPKDPLDALPAGLLGSGAQGDGPPSECGSGICDTSPLLPVIKEVFLKHMEDLPNMVFFDVETTGLDLDCDIVQLSAAVKDQTFNQYVLPYKPIRQQASEITGLTVKDGVLHLKGKKIESVGAKEAFQHFVNWLQPFAPLVLVAHNCYNFDSKRLVNSMEKHGMEPALREVVVGFLDTLPLFRHFLPNLTNHKQETIVRAVLHETYNAHDALQDVKSLQRVVNILNLPADTLKTFSFTFESLKEKMESGRRAKLKSRSLKPLVETKYLSDTLADKLAKAGVDFNLLKSFYVRGGKDFLTQVFSQPNRPDQPHARLSTSTINSISDYFSQEYVENVNGGVGGKVKE